MILSDLDIEREITKKGLVITPFSKDQVEPASYDVLLADEFKFYPSRVGEEIGVISPWNDYSKEMVSAKAVAGEIIINPGTFFLARTVERVELSDKIAGRIEGKSSIARLGLMVHSTAGWLDPGFMGTVTLEMVNVSPYKIILRPGMKIAQIAFQYMFTNAQRPYGHASRNSKYQGQEEVTPSRYHQN